MRARAPRGRLYALLAAGLLLAVGCSEDPDIIDDTFDGNIVIGDATRGVPRRDAQARDSSSADATQLDTGARDVGLDAGDPDPRDVEEPIDGGALDPCDEAPAATLTASAARDRASEFDGQVVVVVATATTSQVQCTEAACPPDNPCCNTCMALVSLDGQLPLRSSECNNVEVGCRGNECQLVCMPLVLSTRERFRGRLRANGRSGPELEFYGVSP